MPALWGWTGIREVPLVAQFSAAGTPLDALVCNAAAPFASEDNGDAAMVWQLACALAGEIGAPPLGVL